MSNITDISIIIPIFNGEKWIDNCMKSIAKQTIFFDTSIRVEIVTFDDGSTDRTNLLLYEWKQFFQQRKINLIIKRCSKCMGVGAAKNKAVLASNGRYLCFQDIDDIMLPNRLQLQLQAACSNSNALVGSQIIRSPAGSTPRLERWANMLEHCRLHIQIYTSHGPTLLMPTWFCHRSIFDKVGGFTESGKGTPEDLIFFYRHLDLGGDLIRVDEKLVIYTYHPDAATFSVARETIWHMQLDRIEQCILPKWDKFTIWNAGKAGRKVVRALSEKARNKVKAFCDVDKNKIGRIVELYCPFKRANLIKLPVIHYSCAQPPLLICVKLDMTNGDFERNLQSLKLQEGVDYILFC